MATSAAQLVGNSSRTGDLTFLFDSVMLVPFAKEKEC
jgi:hypothetical protein